MFLPVIPPPQQNGEYTLFQTKVYSDITLTKYNYYHTILFQCVCVQQTFLNNKSANINFYQSLQYYTTLKFVLIAKAYQLVLTMFPNTMVTFLVASQHCTFSEGKTLLVTVMIMNWERDDQVVMEQYIIVLRVHT